MLSHRQENHEARQFKQGDEDEVEKVSPFEN
jgi:hypothetical protein